MLIGFKCDREMMMQQRLKETWQRHRCCCRTWVTVLVGVLTVVGAISVGRYSVERMGRWTRQRHAKASIPLGKLPGPGGRLDRVEFMLNETNAIAMTGMNDAANERWADVAGNFYSASFVSTFSYEQSGPTAPSVLVQVDREAPTLRGRLEARDLKPNFAYQIKLRGIYEHRDSFERIGYAGRWRLPGRGTNYTDKDYEHSEEPSQVEAYLFFDYFVTDAEGNAARDFALDSCLHVLWNASRQRRNVSIADLAFALVDASNPRTYARPKNSLRAEALWAERERPRYMNPGQELFLPPGEYKAELVLTEESFHSKDNDGGWWATVYRGPIEFALTAGPEPRKKPGEVTEPL